MNGSDIIEQAESMFNSNLDVELDAYKQAKDKEAEEYFESLQ